MDSSRVPAMSVEPQFRWSLRTLLGCILATAVSCAAWVATGFDVFYLPFAVFAWFVALLLLLTRNFELVSSIACAFSILLIVVGGEHVRGPICLLTWYGILYGETKAVAEVLIPLGLYSAIPVAAVLLFPRFESVRLRVAGLSVAAIGFIGLWWGYASPFCSGREHWASLPLFVCLAWRIGIEARALPVLEKTTNHVLR